MEILDGVTVRKYTNHDYPFAYEVHYHMMKPKSMKLANFD